MRWEYKVVRMENRHADAEQNLAILNELGAKGWEIFHIDASVTIVACWMRREYNPPLADVRPHEDEERKKPSKGLKSMGRSAREYLHRKDILQ